VANIKKNLQAGFDKVICAVTTKQALGKLQRCFAEEAVMAQYRVRLTLVAQLVAELCNS